MSNTITAEMSANVWKVLVKAGDHLDEGDTIVILESMKMEIPVLCDDPGTVTTVHVEEGASINAGDLIVDIDED
ncbi:MAG: biotin/lipoyl-binding carrier protein [Cumulibacter sp.]